MMRTAFTYLLNAAVRAIIVQALAMSASLDSNKTSEEDGSDIQKAHHGSGGFKVIILCDLCQEVIKENEQRLKLGVEKCYKG